MDFKDQIKVLGDKVIKLKDQIQTEEATKSAFIMPFIQLLGYDVFNPMEVVPEFVTDFGAKNVEKVDYAILKDNQPVMIIECKWQGENLDKHYTQLHKYFHLTKARFAILTNGIIYNFYTDVENENKMDEKPFLSFDITNMKEQTNNELKKFHKSYFDLDSILNTASELKYANEIKLIMSNELVNPTPAFVKFFVSQVYSGKATEKVMAQFTDIVKRSLNQHISDLISDRLKSALDTEQQKNAAEVEIANAAAEEDSKIETTEEELEGYYIVKSILRNQFDNLKIKYKDNQNYFSVNYDKVTQPICRLWLNGNKKFITIFDEGKKEVKIEIVSIDDIYKYSEQLIKTVSSY